MDNPLEDIRDLIEDSMLEDAALVERTEKKMEAGVMDDDTNNYPLFLMWAEFSRGQFDRLCQLKED